MSEQTTYTHPADQLAARARAVSWPAFSLDNGGPQSGESSWRRALSDPRVGYVRATLADALVVAEAAAAQRADQPSEPSAEEQLLSDRELSEFRAALAADQRALVERRNSRAAQLDVLEQIRDVLEKIAAERRL